VIRLIICCIISYVCQRVSITLLHYFPSFSYDLNFARIQKRFWCSYGLISTEGEDGKERVVLFVSLNSFIDIQNRYLLNVENMTVGGDTKEPRERASRYATGVLLFSTKRRRETQRSRLKNVSSIHHEIKKGIRRILYSDLMITSKLTVCACARARACVCARVCVCVCVCVHRHFPSMSEDAPPTNTESNFSLVFALNIAKYPLINIR